MSEAPQANNTNDKIAALTKEAENLKLKLDDERQKLNDIACMYCLRPIFKINVNYCHFELINI